MSDLPSREELMSAEALLRRFCIEWHKNSLGEPSRIAVKMTDDSIVVGSGPSMAHAVMDAANKINKLIAVQPSEHDMACRMAEEEQLRDEQLGKLIQDLESSVFLLDQFAVNAPPIPSWFVPNTVPRPIPTPEELSGKVGTSSKRNNEWQDMYIKERTVQWPYAWAQLQMKRRAKIISDNVSISERSINVLRSAKDAISGWLEADGGCDHEVGICNCAKRNLRDEMAAILSEIGE